MTDGEILEYLAGRRQLARGRLNKGDVRGAVAAMLALLPLLSGNEDPDDLESLTESVIAHLDCLGANDVEGARVFVEGFSLDLSDHARSGRYGVRWEFPRGVR
jgi:hypothetical protein